MCITNYEISSGILDNMHVKAHLHNTLSVSTLLEGTCPACGVRASGSMPTIRCKHCLISNPFFAPNRSPTAFSPLIFQHVPCSKSLLTSQAPPKANLSIPNYSIPARDPTNNSQQLTCSLPSFFPPILGMARVFSEVAVNRLKIAPTSCINLQEGTS